MNFDDVLELVQPFGTYQLCLCFLVWPAALLQVESIYMNFVGYQQTHWCNIPQLLQLPFQLQVGAKCIPFYKDVHGLDVLAWVETVVYMSYVTILCKSLKTEVIIKRYILNGKGNE